MAQQMNENFGHQLMEYAINRVRGYLDYPYEIDDKSWSENGFSFKIFDGSKCEYRVEDEMRFFWHDGLTDDENNDRLFEAINRFIERWS